MMFPLIPFIDRIINKFTQAARESNVDLIIRYTEEEIICEF